MSTLDDVLGDKELEILPTEEPVKEPAKEAEDIEPKGEPARGADGKFVAKEELAKEPEKQELTEKEKGFLKATEDERHKRQALEKKIAELEAQIGRQNAPPQPIAQPAQPEAPKTFWDDPEAVINRTNQDVASLRNALQMVAVQSRLNSAEYAARGRHADFDEKVGAFKEILEANPGVYKEWLSSPDPAEFAYQKGKGHMEIKELGSIEEYRLKVAKEIRLQVEKEMKDKAEKEAKERSSIPNSLSDARGTAGGAPAWGGPTSLDSVLRDK